MDTGATRIGAQTVPDDVKTMARRVGWSGAQLPETGCPALNYSAAPRARGMVDLVE